MKKIFLVSILVIGAAIAAYFLFIKEPVFHAKSGFLTNINDKGVIMEGYDAVAFSLIINLKKAMLNLVSITTAQLIGLHQQTIWINSKKRLKDLLPNMVRFVGMQ